MMLVIKKIIKPIKYRFILAGTLYLFTGCNENSSTDKKENMPVETNTKKFNLSGKWQIESVGAENTYTLPQFIIFNENNIYSIEGNESSLHPVLDGGYFEYDSLKKELRINTSNDAIKNFRLSGKHDSFSIYENDKLIAKYKREDR
jgi:hypothetical protein